MTVNLLKIIQKLGLSDLQSLTDPAVLEIIHAFDNAPNKKHLSEVLVDIYGSEEFLTNKDKRSVLIEHLPLKNALELAGMLRLNNNNKEPWDALSKINFRSSSQKQLLFNFFNIPLLKEDKNTANKIEHIATKIITPKYSLFDHQERAAQLVKNTLKTNKRVLLHMPTGAGKTRTSMNVVCDYFRSSIEFRQNKLIVWLADTEELCEQASDEFTKAWEYLGSGEILHTKLYGKNNPDLSEIKSGFLVAGLAKLNSQIDRNQMQVISMARNCSLIIFDEAHKVLAKTYQHAVGIFETVGTEKLIGLSATPGRATKDEDENLRFADFFDKKKVTLEIDGYTNPVQYLQEEGYLANVRFHDMPYQSTDITLTKNEIQKLTDKEEVPERVLKELGKDTLRNIKILTLAIELIEKNKKIILFACSVAHTEALYALLKYKGVKVGCVTANTNKRLRKETIDLYKTGKLDILINFGVLTTGFDAPITNVALIARPTNSLTLYSQMVGRAARGIKAGGSKDCDIYTVIDTVIPGFRNITEAFKHWDDAWSNEE